jgi:hypothetical protein
MKHTQASWDNAYKPLVTETDFFTLSFPEGRVNVRIIMILWATSMLLFVLCVPGMADDEIGLCCLCEECEGPVGNRGTNVYVNAFGKTCNDLTLEMADPFNGSRAGNRICRSLQDEFRSTCCDPNFTPPDIVQIPNIPINYVPFGPNPRCDLCHDGAFPSKPHTVTAVLGIPGNPTCEELYWLARRGHVTDQMCKPLQDYMDEPCGCYSRFPSPTYPNHPSAPSPSGTPLPPTPPPNMDLCYANPCDSRFGIFERYIMHRKFLAETFCVEMCAFALLVQTSASYGFDCGPCPSSN